MAYGVASSLQLAALRPGPAGRPAAPASAEAGERSIVVANTPHELRASASLLQSLYAARGYLLAGAEAEPDADVVLVAIERGETIGTLTLRPDGPRGLRADQAFGELLDALRARGRCLCELGRLAVARTPQSNGIVHALFGGARDLVRGRAELTDVLIEVNPRHAAFYRRVFGFAPVAPERSCPRVRAPAVLLRLDVATFETGSDRVV